MGVKMYKNTDLSLVIYSLLLLGCVTQNSTDIEHAVEDQYTQDMAEQAASDWEIEQDHANFEKWVDEQNALDDQYSYDEEGAYDDQIANCPLGCTFQKMGCDIKGNIAFNSKEKIYHVPG